MARRSLCTLLLLLGVACAALAQSDSMAFAAASKSKFVNLPNLPSCLTVAVQHGDPSKGPSVLLLKFQPGCTIPWHWHTAAESLMMVSGNGKVETKDGPPMMARSGDYVYLPSKHVHQFTAISRVMLFDAPDGAFDIHYVDKAGNEIPLSKAGMGVIKVKPASGPTTTVPQ